MRAHRPQAGASSILFVPICSSRSMQTIWDAQHVGYQYDQAFKISFITKRKRKLR